MGSQLHLCQILLNDYLLLTLVIDGLDSHFAVSELELIGPSLLIVLPTSHVK